MRRAVRPAQNPGNPSQNPFSWRFLTYNEFREQSYKGTRLTTYETDVVAWAREQTALLRAGRLNEIDAEHIADEIEDVARAEIRELTKRAAVLVRYMIEFDLAPGANCTPAIHRYRDSIARRLRRMPSLNAAIDDPEFWLDVWDDAILGVLSERPEIGAARLPAKCPWSACQILNQSYPGKTS